MGEVRRNGTRVLVVDDDDFIRRLLGRNLQQLGCEVLVAVDGEQAIRMAVDTVPDVIFLDLRLPGLDGHALLRRLPEASVDAGVVVMSGEGDMDEAIDALRLGAVDYLKKPWTTDELSNALASAVDVARARGLGDDDA